MAEISKHQTTMTPWQRRVLVRVLEPTHKIEDLVIMTDAELHEQWLIDCEYPNPYKDGK